MRHDPAQLNTLIIKIGTSLLSGQRAFEGQVMEAVVKELCQLKEEHDLNILIVTSGAVGCGMNALGLKERPSTLSSKQAVAAVGQATLMHYYETLFLTYGENLHTAQVLLTLADLDNRKTYLNVRNTLQALLDMKRIIPIINENDSTATEELRFGDNDTLAARIAAKLNAGLLIILTDVDGLFDKNPARHTDARLIEEVREITPEVEALAEGAGSIASTGGMLTKLNAAKITASAGVPMVLANGHRKNIIHDTLSGQAPGTLFTPNTATLSHRKRWIAYGRAPHGAILVDAGAAEALSIRGRSLLPAGILEVRGAFSQGDAVSIQDEQGREFGRALVNFSSQELLRIKGHRSSDVAAILGHAANTEVVHRDNLVLF